MIINSIPGAAVASSVWANATRTLTNPSGVWSDATRTVTSLGAGAFSPVGIAATSIAGGASVDLRAPSSRMRHVCLGVLAASAAALTINVWDGTISRAIQSVASATAGGLGVTVGSATIGIRLINTDGANAASYMYGGTEWIQ